MRKSHIILAMFLNTASLLFAETNALVEVHFFKDWVVEGEPSFGNFNLAIKNTGTDPILLAKTPFDFEVGQLGTRTLPHTPDKMSDERQEQEHKLIADESAGFNGFFSLLPDETHVYEGRKFFLSRRLPFSEEIRFTVSVYLGKGFWLDSEPMMFQGVVPDSVEQLTTIGLRELTLITYKNERWLYSTLQGSSNPFSVCPLSLTNKIRVEPHDGKGLFKIWDGDKSMIFDMYKVMLTEGPDENNVYGKWTRERKQRAEADNAEVRRKKAEAQAP
ncbi:MAG: hypothetical protein FWG50_11950 [Kiritimatiellaeota bacterium]|nr:hypothetical protein [Kiritimatiellota bacterium]